MLIPSLLALAFLGAAPAGPAPGRVPEAVAAEHYTFEVVVLAREGAAGARVWRGSVRQAITGRADFERAIKEGTLWPKSGRP